ncbi:MAG: DUF1015 domain-containing protein [Candidatus Omnitrophota bacterium]|nr:DUF1015 domain-containing protein [Candidatus Omnitrophota bacterium]
MISIKPFRAIRYNPAKVKDLSRVVSPPYDIIPARMQEGLYRTHPNNIVRLILGKQKKSDSINDNRYTRAKGFFETWLKARVMIRDDEKAMYIYSQIYREGKRIIDMAGFIGLMGLDTGKGASVLPHENTLASPKTDRMNLMRQVRANLSPILVLYEDRGRKVKNILKEVRGRKDKKIIDFEFDNVRHRVWRLDDKYAINKIEGLMAAKDIFIADGHHRYEVARDYSLGLQDEPVPREVKDSSKYMMAYFVESDEAMLTILPAHRLIKDAGRLSKEDAINRLDEFFVIRKMPGLKTLMSELGRMADKRVFGIYLGKGNFYILKLRDAGYSDRVIRGKSKDWKRLDVSILHQFILQHVLGIRDEDDNVEFFKNPADAVRLVDNLGYKMAFFLNPTKVSQVKRIAKLGEKMPRKATYFYPKPLSGLVIHKFEDER